MESCGVPEGGWPVVNEAELRRLSAKERARLMQMLAAGGLDILSDGLREADEDNPRGYFEFERVKKLRSDSKWLSEDSQMLPAIPS